MVWEWASNWDTGGGRKESHCERVELPYHWGANTKLPEIRHPVKNGVEMWISVSAQTPRTSNKQKGENIDSFKTSYRTSRESEPNVGKYLVNLGGCEWKQTRNKMRLPHTSNLKPQQKQLENVEESEADVSSSHAVSQFVLVPDERHEAHVNLY